MDTQVASISRVVNDAAMNMELLVSFQISVFVFFRYVSRYRLLDRMVVLFLVS